jgi:hypothetical protein
LPTKVQSSRRRAESPEPQAAVLKKSDDAVGAYGRAVTNDLIRTRSRIKLLNVR